jgi:hypothetical protein
MPKRIIPLTDMHVSRAKSQKKQVTIFDGGGLFLLITPSGGKLWRFKYRFEGKEKLLALGAYPEMSLADARQRREEARKHLDHGIDPGASKRPRRPHGPISRLIVLKWLPGNGMGNSKNHGLKAMLT